ncbi:MAG: hypothetical protein KDK23_11750 [Leptospiraceae bacterium]|nr:hypothetical protein [Leptospiraceae bacterium]
MKRSTQELTGRTPSPRKKELIIRGMAGALLLYSFISCCSGGQASHSKGPEQALSPSGEQKDGPRKKPSDGIDYRTGNFTIYGLLIRRSPAPRSVEAYTGAEFFLHDPHHFGSGNPFVKDRVVLLPSEEVSREELLKYNHEFVTVIVTRSEGTLPDPRSSYPTNPDGSPMRQNEGWKVVRILPDH